ncbi:hypothetical protein, partial [Streptomyces sp. CC53]|uniref:hypothetical protein n=1 Tax=Streptomyces sp. CC53 TaxID=1906740 RepID=UPI001C4314F2
RRDRPAAGAAVPAAGLRPLLHRQVQSVTAAARPLPGYGVLSGLQRYGLDCVFCGVQLTPGGGVSLGWLRHRPSPGVRVVWAPRACRGCLAEESP